MEWLLWVGGGWVVVFVWFGGVGWCVGWLFVYCVGLVWGWWGGNDLVGWIGFWCGVCVELLLWFWDWYVYFVGYVLFGWDLVLGWLVVVVVVKWDVGFVGGVVCVIW